MIDEKKLIRDLRKYADELGTVRGEIELANGVLKAISIVKNQPNTDRSLEKGCVGMKYPKEEILNALKVIQSTCKEQDHGGIVDCLSCPLADEGHHCIINEQLPMAWDIKNEVGVWRAFE